MTVASDALRARLEKLLLDLFGPYELRRFLRRLPGGDELELTLPGPAASARQVATEAVLGLDRRAMIDSSFFAALLADRPQRHHEIIELQDKFIVRPPPSVPVAAAPFGKSIAQVFKTTGVPDATIIEPDELPNLKFRLQIPGEGLVVDGPSGIGKSTVVRLALESNLGARLDELSKDGRVTWIQGKQPEDQARLDALLAQGFRALRGHLIVDDFHLLPPGLQGRIADTMKAIADWSADNAKIVVIGINPAGASLVRGFPDLAGRFDVITMGRQPPPKIQELIERGEQATNLVFRSRDRLVQAASGSMYAAQLLCLEAALSEGIGAVPEARTEVVAGPDGRVTERVISKLKFKFHDPLIAFASYGASRPSEGGTLALLWLLRESLDGAASLAVARARWPAVARDVDWLLSSNLAGLFARDPDLGRILYYNRDAGVLSAEDPQLEFYLRHVAWPALLRDSGHPRLGFDPADGPCFGAEPPTHDPRRTPASPPRPALPTSRFLHLSDLHVTSRDQALLWYDQLTADLRSELGIERLDGVIVSGDISNHALATEFDAATLFLRATCDSCGVTPDQLVIVPGNHDLSWALSRQSYQVHRKADYPAELNLDRDLDLGDTVAVQDPTIHRTRFQAFADFYLANRAEAYPLDAEYQFTLHPFPAQRLLVLGLNSSWRVDHARRDSADIHNIALSNALQAIDRRQDFNSFLKIAVWHHPIQSPDADRIRDTGFLERLAQRGFRLGLHGHLHRPTQTLYRYDLSTAGRRLDVLGAGTFGAPTREWQPGYPLQYQILEFSGSTLTVHTRRREEPNGAWKPDARWTQGPGADPLPRYTVEL